MNADMKVFLQNDDYCRVITVKDGEIDLNHYDDIWDIHTCTEFNGEEVDVCITGDKADGESDAIDYTCAVRVEAYREESYETLFSCLSPIIADGYSRKSFVISPDELIRQMAQIAMPLMADSPFVRDFSSIDAEFVRETDTANPFLWLVRENGTSLYDLVAKREVTGFTTTMDMYRDKCCLFFYDGLYLRPIMPQTAREMLEKIDNQNKQSHEENRV